MAIPHHFRCPSRHAGDDSPGDAQTTHQPFVHNLPSLPYHILDHRTRHVPPQIRIHPHWSSRSGRVNGVSEIILIPCDTLVLASGPWLGKLAIELLGEEVGKQLEVGGAQANSIILRTKEPLTAHEVFARIAMGAEKGDENEPEVYCRPDGTTYLCVSTLGTSALGRVAR